jgi:hypothetical protein
MTEEKTGAESRPIKPDEFRVNGVDNAGEKVLRIYYKNQRYVIYRTQEVVHVDIDDDCEDVISLVAKHAEILLELTQVDAILPARINGIEGINRQIARSITQNFEGSQLHAKANLTDALERVRRLRLVRGRLQYVFSSLAATIMVVAAVFASKLLIYEGQSWVSAQSALYMRIAACGAMGGFLSIALGFRGLEIETDANWLTNCLVGGSRILIAVMAGVFSFFVIRSGIALQVLTNRNESGPYGLYALAMIAGFSERLVPNLMENLGRQSSPHANTADKGDGPPAAVQTPQRTPS